MVMIWDAKTRRYITQKHKQEKTLKGYLAKRTKKCFFMFVMIVAGIIFHQHQKRRSILFRQQG